MTTPHTDKLRSQMVTAQLVSRGVTDGRVLRAMATVPREAFVPEAMQPVAYNDSPLPIDAGQTISQPYIVARMAEALALRGDERVLEVGTGSGYAAAVLARLAREVVTVERHLSLAAQAAGVLEANGFQNVTVHVGDGTLGWPAGAPYDAITVAAASPAVPPALLAQLAVGGRLVIPVGSAAVQELVLVTRTANDTFAQERLESVRFVPLIGAEGWPDQHKVRAS